MCWIICQVCIETENLPDLPLTGSVGAYIEAMKSFSKLCLKLNIQEILLPTAEDPGGEYTNLLMGRVMKNWKNLKHGADCWLCATIKENKPIYRIHNYLV